MAGATTHPSKTQWVNSGEQGWVNSRERQSNPLLGDISPRDMIRLGRFERLRKFIINAVLKQTPAIAQEPEMA